jgi:cell cycle checkpoint control protein RAD9A
VHLLSYLDALFTIYQFSFTALNSSKSAYAQCTLDAVQFFSKYECVPTQGGPEGRFTCSISTRALLSVFKGRLYDPLGRDGAIDRCEVSVQDKPDQTECRFIIKMICNQGVIKTYKLTYEAVDVMHALFDRNVAKNRWSMHSSAVKEYVEYFGSKTEMLDIFSGDGEDGRAVFKSYTEKISNGKEILKHPLVTAVAVNTSDFEEFNVQPGMHIIISVKDFKAIVLHADTLKTNLKSYYSQPTRPLQFSYGCDGLVCEFTLMTSGDYSTTASQTPAPAVQMPSRENSRLESRNRSFDMPPPAEPPSRLERAAKRRHPGSRKANSSKPAAPDPDSLFVQQDEDERWEPLDYNQEEETLGWDASADHGTATFPTFTDSGSAVDAMSKTETETEESETSEVIAPTQRVSQIKGLW